MNVVVATALGTQFCCNCDNGMHVYMCSQAQQETEQTLQRLAARYKTRYTNKGKGVP